MKDVSVEFQRIKPMVEFYARAGSRDKYQAQEQKKRRGRNSERGRECAFPINIHQSVCLSGFNAVFAGRSLHPPWGGTSRRFPPRPSARSPRNHSLILNDLLIYLSRRTYSKLTIHNPAASDLLAVACLWSRCA